MINKAEIECRFRKSIESYDDNAFAQKSIIRHLMTLLGDYCALSAPRILEVGCGTGLLTEQLRQKWGNCSLTINDLVDAMCWKTARRCHLPVENCIPGDIESVHVPGEYDLIISASTFQWLAHPAETFARFARHLPHGGWLVFSTFGEDNYRELKSVTGQGLVYRSISEITHLLSPCFEVVHTEENRHILEFAEPLDILKHIKNTGVNATNPQQAWTKGRLNEFVREYSNRFLQNGCYPLTYHPQYFVCRKL